VNNPLVCVSVAMHPTPPTKSTQDVCLYCGQPLWVSHVAPPHSHCVCLDCFAEEVRPGDIILSPTEEQLREIIDTIKKERMQ
jgi:hypothetical protein